MLEDLEGNQIRAVVKFNFVASNNEVEYEAILARIRLAKEMVAESVNIYSDSQLVVFLVARKYQAKEANTATYL